MRRSAGGGLMGSRIDASDDRIVGLLFIGVGLGLSGIWDHGFFRKKTQRSRHLSVGAFRMSRVLGEALSALTDQFGLTRIDQVLSKRRKGLPPKKRNT
jgi:hypothetical protein